MSGVRLCIPFFFVGCAYTPGSFSRLSGEFPGSRETVGCIDVAFLGRHDAVTTNPVIEFTFGNRCDRGVTIDFAAVRVRGNDGRREVELDVVDPRKEIYPAILDGGWTGREVIEYRRRDRGNDPIVGLCVDVSGIDRERREPSRWTCSPASDAAIGGVM